MENSSQPNTKHSSSQSQVQSGKTQPRPAPHLSRSYAFQAAMFIMSVLCFFFGFTSLSIVQQNTHRFVEFAENALPSEIEKIEMQETDPYGNGIGITTTITGKNSISAFTSAIKTIDAMPQSYRSGLGNFRRIKIWLTENRTIEFTCYTVQGQGKTVFVDSIEVKPSIYGFGNGKIGFIAPDFYDWLNEYSFPMQ
jgi:hypothetical protein